MQNECPSGTDLVKVRHEPDNAPSDDLELTALHATKGLEGPHKVVSAHVVAQAAYEERHGGAARWADSEPKLDASACDSNEENTRNNNVNILHHSDFAIKVGHVSSFP